MKNLHLSHLPLSLVLLRDAFFINSINKGAVDDAPGSVIVDLLYLHVIKQRRSTLLPMLGWLPQVYTHKDTL